MKFREKTLESGTKIKMGKDAESNDELMKEFQGKENVILHTEKPGSPFCVIENLRANKKDLHEAAIFCASKSQDWRDNKKDVSMSIFTGKNINKTKGMKAGMWKVKKAKTIKVKKEEIEELGK